MDVDDIRFKIAAARRMMYREGVDSQTAGHVSVRAAGETRSGQHHSSISTRRCPTT